MIQENQQNCESSQIHLDNEDIEILSYNFTKKEMFLLAKFLRKKEEELPLGLEAFCKTLEDSVYNSLSIQEVRKFYL